MQSTSVVCTHKIYKMYTWCCRGAATLGQLGYAGLHSGGAAIQGSCRKMVAWVRMTVSPDAKSIGLPWDMEQPVMGLPLMPFWLKIKIVSVACLCDTKPTTGLSHRGVGILVYEERFCVC